MRVAQFTSNHHDFLYKGTRKDSLACKYVGYACLISISIRELKKKRNVEIGFIVSIT